MLSLKKVEVRSVSELRWMTLIFCIRGYIIKPYNSLPQQLFLNEPQHEQRHTSFFSFTIKHRCVMKWRGLFWCQKGKYLSIYLSSIDHLFNCPLTAKTGKIWRTAYTVYIHWGGGYSVLTLFQNPFHCKSFHHSCLMKKSTLRVSLTDI